MLARHTWDAPYRALAAASQTRSYRLLTPEIGEALRFDETDAIFPPWWEKIA